MHLDYFFNKKKAPSRQYSEVDVRVDIASNMFFFSFFSHQKKVKNWLIFYFVNFEKFIQRIRQMTEKKY